jgi:hypothetical protein
LAGPAIRLARDHRDFVESPLGCMEIVKVSAM